jgi:hypothetical protein
MAGLEYRGALTNTIPTPAKDFLCDTVYWPDAKPGDPVIFEASGKAVKAPITGKVQGVLAAKEYIMEKEPPIVKVRLDKAALYEAEVTGGTPVVGGEYELTADVKVNVAANTNAAVKVQQILPEGTVIVTLL